MSDVGHKAQYERNHNNVNPMWSVASEEVHSEWRARSVSQMRMETKSMWICCAFFTGT